MPLQERKVLEDLAQRLDALNAKEQGLHSVIEHRNLQAFNSGYVAAGALNQRLRVGLQTLARIVALSPSP